MHVFIDMKATNNQPEANYHRNGCVMIDSSLNSSDDENNEIVQETNSMSNTLHETYLIPGIARICWNDTLTQEYACWKNGWKKSKKGRRFR